jgi:hypothetical protein
VRAGGWSGTTRLRQSTALEYCRLPPPSKRTVAHAARSQQPDRWRSVRYFGAAESSGGTMGHADLLEDQLCVCRLQLVDVPRLSPINTQHSTVGCCASVSVGTVAQHRCGRAANAHSDVPGRGCAACTSARARSTGRRPTGPRRCTPRGSACQSGRTGCTPARRQPAPMRMCLAPLCTS